MSRNPKKNSARGLPRKANRMSIGQLFNIAVGDLNPDDLPNADGVEEVYSDATGETLTRTEAARIMLYLATTSQGFALALPPAKLAEMKDVIAQYAINRNVAQMESQFEGQDPPDADA